MNIAITNITGWNKAFRMTLHATCWLLMALFKIILIIGSFFIALYFGSNKNNHTENENDNSSIQDKHSRPFFAPKNFLNVDDDANQ